MCLIIVKPSGVSIDKELILQSVADNKDGWGVARAIDGELVIDRGMNKDDYIEYVEAIPKEQDAIIHTRIGTTGSKLIHNCHPFLISKEVCMMHNGSISVDRPFTEMSDTWSFAFNIVRPMLERNPSAYGDESFTKLMSDAVETRNKLVFLNRHGKIVICNKSQGNEYKGLWLSNGRSLYGPHWPGGTPVVNQTYNPTQHQGHRHTPANQQPTVGCEGYGFCG